MISTLSSQEHLDGRDQNPLTRVICFLRSVCFEAGRRSLCHMVRPGKPLQIQVHGEGSKLPPWGLETTESDGVAEAEVEG